jgi:hypothetical protein
MRWHKIIIMIGLIIASSNQSAALDENDNISSLKSLIASFDDPGMDANDLAFFLVTHNFDAAPAGSIVEVKIDGKVYRLAPNGKKTGLCEILE